MMNNRMCAMFGIDAHIGGKPYGIDVLMPTTFPDAAAFKFDAVRLFPREHLEFVHGLLDEAGIHKAAGAPVRQVVHDMLEEMLEARDRPDHLLS